MPIGSTRYPVAVIFERTVLANRWVSERWEAVAALPTDNDEVSAPALVDDVPPRTRWRFEGCALELHRSEADGYFLNISSAEPKVFVMWRRREDSCEDDSVPSVRPQALTVSYNEAARLMDGGEQVDAVPMPPQILEWMTPFVAEHYKGEPRRKVKRNDPFADEHESGHRRRIG